MSLNDPTPGKPSGTTRTVRRMASLSAAGMLLPSMPTLASPSSWLAVSRSSLRPDVLG
jgi:hypothetical protein